MEAVKNGFISALTTNELFFKRRQVKYANVAIDNCSQVKFVVFFDGRGDVRQFTRVIVQMSYNFAIFVQLDDISDFRTFDQAENGF